jgi:hypothetical protein
MNRETLYQKHRKQHSWKHKPTYLPRNQHLGPKRKYAPGCTARIRLVGNILQHRDEAPRRHISPRNEGLAQKYRSPHTKKSPHHHNSPRHRSRADDLGLHHHDTTIAQDTEEEVDDPDLHDIHTTMKTMKSGWGR